VVAKGLYSDVVAKGLYSDVVLEISPPVRHFTAEQS